MKIINEANLVGVIGKPGNLIIDAITEFQEFNRILKEYGWVFFIFNLIKYIYY